MKSKIGRAIRDELRDVHVDDALRLRIEDGARRRSVARRRRASRLMPVAAALAFLAVGAGLLLSALGPRPDAQRTPVLEKEAADGSQTAGQPVEAATEEDPEAGNLFVYVTAFEGGVLSVESSFDYDLNYFEAEAAVEGWERTETAEPPRGAPFTGEDVDAWMTSDDGDQPLGLQYSQVEIALREGSPASADAEGTPWEEYRFVRQDTVEETLTLYLTDGEWEGETASLEVLPSLGSWVYDGEEIWSDEAYLRDAVRRLGDDTFAVASAGATADAPAPEVFEMPVERGGEARVYQGGAGWSDNDGDDDEVEFGMDITLIRFDGEATALVLNPWEGHALTARFHAVQSPRMVLDEEAHPGMAGWVFDEAPDDGDVLDIVDEHGRRTYITMAELAKAVGLEDAEENGAEEDGEYADDAPEYDLVSPME